MAEPRSAPIVWAELNDIGTLDLILDRNNSVDTAVLLIDELIDLLTQHKTIITTEIARCHECKRRRAGPHRINCSQHEAHRA